MACFRGLGLVCTFGTCAEIVLLIEAGSECSPSLRV